ncbi:MAG: class I SAM-dependent methyltransferase, partial [Anaerolineae bacterium]|nr:class I SAM-dependent methyltransferase [Anaerolineae bacterium]
MSGLPPATESEIKTREKQFFAAYYASLDRAEHLGDGSLFAYFAAELARAERLYGHSFQHPASVLSVGAGWGTISVWAGWQYPQWRIVSMDYVEDSLPYHHEIARLSQTEWRGHLAVEDWDALPHARHTFDYVLADRALHHA